MTNSITEAHVPTRDVQNSFEMGRDTASTCYLVGVMLMFKKDVMRISNNFAFKVYFMLGLKSVRLDGYVA